MYTYELQKRYENSHPYNNFINLIKKNYNLQIEKHIKKNYNGFHTTAAVVSPTSIIIIVV